MEKLLWTIGETASLLGENVSAVRYWANSFAEFIKPTRTAKGDRRFTADDIATLTQLLSLDPRPHYHDDPERVYGMPFKGRDVRFRVADGVLTVVEVVNL